MRKKIMKVTVHFDEKTWSSITTLRHLLDIHSLVDLFSFMLSITNFAVEAALKGKKLAFYDPSTEEVETVKDPSLQQLYDLHRDNL